MTEKALVPSTPTTDIVRHARTGNFALIKTVHGELDTVVTPDGKVIVGVSQRPGKGARTLSLSGVVADATDIVGQGGADARRAYGEVYVVVGRPDGQGGQVLQEVLFDYPGKRVITNPGAPNQHEYPADGLPQQFTTDRPYQFVPTGGDKLSPRTSNGVVLAAYMYAPDEAAAVPNFNGNLTLTHEFVDPASPLTPQGTKQAPVADRDPIATAVAAARAIVGPLGGPPAVR